MLYIKGCPVLNFHINYSNKWFETAVPAPFSKKCVGNHFLSLGEDRDAKHFQHLHFSMFYFRIGENEQWQNLRRQTTPQPFFRMYIYIYVVGSKSGPHFPLDWVNKWPTSTHQKGNKTTAKFTKHGELRVY